MTSSKHAIGLLRIRRVTRVEYDNRVGLSRVYPQRANHGNMVKPWCAIYSQHHIPDLDWYAAHEIEPGPGEDWTHVDARAVPAKGTTLRHENIADTNPDVPSDRFEILAIDPGPPIAVTFRPGSTGRVYRLLAIDNLLGVAWTNVPGAGPRTGEGEGEGRQDTLTDDNDPPLRSGTYVATLGG